MCAWCQLVAKLVASNLISKNKQLKEEAAELAHDGVKDERVPLPYISDNHVQFLIHDNVRLSSKKEVEELKKKNTTLSITLNAAELV